MHLPCPRAAGADMSEMYISVRITTCVARALAVGLAQVMCATLALSWCRAVDPSYVAAVYQGHLHPIHRLASKRRVVHLFRLAVV